jgi:hypothetical protein
VALRKWTVSAAAGEKTTDAARRAAAMDVGSRGRIEGRLYLAAGGVK